MTPVVRLTDELFARLARHNPDFKSPSQVIEVLLDHYEGINTAQESNPHHLAGFVKDMNRKQFVLSVGCEKANWNWSWSFVNHDEKFVLFTTWENLEDSNGQVILDPKWERSGTSGRRSPGYGQALRHLALVEDEGYKLKTFRIAGPNGGDEGAKIEALEPILNDKSLKRIGNKWYAV